MARKRKQYYRPDRDGEFRKEFDLNKKKIFATQKICGICGQPVDFNRKFPDPLSPCIDHIIPVKLNGAPADISNLQLAHLSCNRAKSDKLVMLQPEAETRIDNRDLPQSVDWRTF